MRPHPFAEEYPTVSAEKLAEITDNMREHGFDRRFPVVVYRNMILDGRTREAAAKAAGIKPKRITFKGTAEQARQFVETANLHRRHLTPEEQEQRRKARVTTVAELRQEGKSTRAIAGIVGVSQTQVVEDIKAAGEQGCSPEPADAQVTGGDGKVYPAAKPQLLCGRCRRMSIPVKNCPQCAEERKAKKSGRSEPGTHQHRATGAKGGAPAFDWKTYYDRFGGLRRQVSDFGRIYGQKDSGEAERLRAELDAWSQHFKTWAETVARVKPPAA